MGSAPAPGAGGRARAPPLGSGEFTHWLVFPGARAFGAGARRTTAGAVVLPGNLNRSDCGPGLGILPNPVARAEIIEPVFVCAGDASIIIFIPADRLEHEVSPGGSAIVQWLAIDDSKWNGGDEWRSQRVEIFRIFVVGEAIPFQGAGHAGKVD